MKNFTEKGLKSLAHGTNILGADLSSVTDIDLSWNDLGSESLGPRVKKQILVTIARAPVLRRLIITTNPLPAEIVLDLHRSVEKMNAVRNVQVSLVSDYSLWYKKQNFPVDASIVSIECFWLLREWQSTEYPKAELIRFIDEVRESPEQLDHFKRIFQSRLHARNRRGRTLFTECLRLPSFELAGFILENIGADAFTLQIESIIGAGVTLPEDAIPTIITRGLLTLSNRPDLAKAFATQYLTENPAVQFQIFAHIAVHEEKFTDAYDFLVQAISKGSISARIQLVTLMESVDDLDRRVLTLHEKIELLTSSADQGCVGSVVKLCKLNESIPDMLASKYWVDRYHQMIIENPMNRLQITNDACTLMDHRKEFYDDINSLVCGTLTKRVEFMKETWKTTLPAYNVIEEARLTQAIFASFEKPTVDHFIKTIGYGFMEFCYTHKVKTEDLANYLADQINSDSTPNKGLLSNNPEIFAQTFHEIVNDFCLKRLKLSMPTPAQRCSGRVPSFM